MSEYHKIETLFERDPATFKVRVGAFRNPVYEIIKSWHWTEKIDGTNIRAIWKDGSVSFGGRTDNAQLPADLIKHLYENITPSLIAAVFIDSPSVVLYGEGYGAGIQKSGTGYSATKRFILFDVLVANRWWLPWEAVKDVAQKLSLDAVPYIGDLTIDEAIEMVRTGFQSRLNGGLIRAEGLVGRPLDTLFDKRGSRLIVKLKTGDFA